MSKNLVRLSCSMKELERVLNRIRFRELALKISLKNLTRRKVRGHLSVCGFFFMNTVVDFRSYLGKTTEND